LKCVIKDYSSSLKHKDSWFTLIQRAIGIASSFIGSDKDMDKIREIGNNM